MKRTRRNHEVTFKAQVALAAVKGDKTLAEQFSVHPTLITEWKQQLLTPAAVPRRHFRRWLGRDILLKCRRDLGGCQGGSQQRAQAGGHQRVIGISPSHGPVPHKG
ncbi:MAG: hypothetical protein E8D41_06915 [Nitrospira sp.]|nr:MAG: hypothetical protein E8D41_06915 [Nitrospira sp.]